MEDNKCPLSCPHLVLGLWGGYKCLKYDQVVGDNCRFLPRKILECLRGEPGVAGGKGV